MALNADVLSTAIVSRLQPLFANSANPPSSADTWKVVCEEIISHFVTNAEIYGITVDTGTPLVATLAVGVPVPGDGGAALQATLAIAAADDFAVQKNDGPGHLK